MAMLMDTLSLELESTSTGFEKGFREPSFSSYLNRAEEGFVLSLVKQSCGVKADDDGEIDVFSAEKYFNESLDEEEEKPKVDEKPVTVDNPIRTKSQPRALSERSVSSWNSQSALMQRPRVKNPSVKGGGKVKGRGYLASSAFRCRCVCSDKNSVAVKEYERCSDILTQNVKKEPLKKGFTCPVTVEIPCMLDKGLKRETCSISKDSLSIEEDMPMKPRKSLEVFGNLLVRERPNKPFSFGTEKKLTSNRENEFPSPTETAIPTVVHGSYADSDSDVSSDLFEIEDFTGKANILLSRQMSGNMSGSTTPTAGYAPSEASIAWSVVTASAADVSDTKIAMSQDLEAQVFKPEAKLTVYEPGKRNMRLGIHSRAPALPNSRHVSNTLYFK